MINGVSIGFLEAIAPYGAWVAAFFALLAWISPTLYRKYRNYKIKNGVSISELELSGVVASDEHQQKIVPFWNIKVIVENRSKYPVDIKSQISVNGRRISRGGFQSTTTREALNHVFSLTPKDQARCFFARLMPNIPQSNRDSDNIADPREYIRSFPPTADASAWIEFVGEIPPGTTGGAWTAQSGASIDIHSNESIKIEILSLGGAVLDSFSTTTTDILTSAKQSGWSNIGEIKTPNVVSTANKYIQEIKIET